MKTGPKTNMRMKSMQTKTHKTRHVYSGIAYSSLADLLEIIDLIIESNPSVILNYSDFKFDYEDDYDSDRLTILEYYLPETESEKVKREKIEADQKKSREEYERKQFEALKKKYGTSE